MIENKATDASPILRWAGGKNWLVKHINKLIPENFNNYHEPFIGGASIFLAVNPSNNTYISDLNKDLIDTYKAVKENPKNVIDNLKTFENTKEFYYHLREQELNNEYAKAARFIYLNQTSFNGIYRVNLKGKYNVPYGHRTKNFIEEEKIYRLSERFLNSTIEWGDFEINKDYIQERDLVFLDPPYTVSHNKNGFIKYNQRLFSLEDQYRLSEYIDFIKNRNAYYILTNAAHEKVKEIFHKGDKRFVKNRASLIGGNNSKRGIIEEYIFTNI
ncbi:DNA adenine methylase [Mesonia maritima]|uniref:site-specific DNA-methyltransferase (adenine-specific) n=1 Tax=Mesonia maritima TaxID=1793873 RepID=A0ABU1K502_9FLAO|nr:Dam family site-specific DNA-(adenine-N6)-methyltransferase [Mesonia maritima]MDR6300669.1 DNA adenine methylase [Mesonia maritima]